MSAAHDSLTAEIAELELKASKDSSSSEVKRNLPPPGIDSCENADNADINAAKVIK